MTSNLSHRGLGDFQTFEDKYGKRVGSRLTEMFNFIYLSGQDKRK
jgi:DNA replication protein DnaC